MKQHDIITCPDCGTHLSTVLHEPHDGIATVNCFEQTENIKKAISSWRLGQDLMQAMFSCVCSGQAFSMPNIHTQRGWVGYKVVD